MSWQDWVLSIGAFIFTVALIPSLTSKNKPALVTSISTTMVLLLFAVVYFSLNFWLATASVLINAFAWFALAIQTKRQNQQLH